MKRSVAVSAALLFLSPVLAHALWETNGNNVTQQVIRRFDHYPQIARDGQGGAILAWDTESDWGPYDQDVAVCRVSFEGGVLWSAFATTEAGLQRGSAIVEDGAGGAIVVWFDERTTTPGPGIYAQRYDADGAPQWMAGGIRVGDTEPVLSLPGLRIHAVSDGAGGVYVVWNAFGIAFNWDVNAQHVLADGSLPWGASGLGVTAGTQDYQFSCDAAADGAGGLLVTWVTAATWQDIFAQHFEANGTRLWGNNGVIVTDAISDQYSPRIVPTASGGALVIWDEEGITPITEIYAQRLDSSGMREWALTGVSISMPGVYATEGSARLVADGADGAHVIFTDNRNEPSAQDLFAVHLLSTGATAAPARALAVTPSRVTDAAIVSDGAGGAFVTWHYHDTIGGLIYDDVYVQWLDDDGSDLLTHNGVQLCDENFEQTYPQVVLASPGRFIAVWEDTRDQFLGYTDCFAQLIEGNTAGGDSVTVSPVDLTTGTTPATVTFDNVTVPGATSLTTGLVGPPVPGTFLAAGAYYNLTTNATFSGLVEVCIVYDPLLLSGPETDVRLIHFDGTVWTDITTSVDTLANVVCGTTTSLSPFVIGTGMISSGVGDARAPGAPALHANVPNPFNPQTIIGYDIPAGGADVNISIYDVSGRLVRELVNEHRAEGTWSVQWNGEDERGRRVASGVYFYRLRADAFTETKKMILLK